jgi:hypothetical protein
LLELSRDRRDIVRGIKTIEEYQDKANNGFAHYLSKCSFWKDCLLQLDGIGDGFGTAIPALGYGLLHILALLTLPLTWIPVRILAYHDLRKQLELYHMEKSERAKRRAG